jgi:hypothetical protein
MADQGGILGQDDYPDEQRRALISDIHTASADERLLLIGLSVDCKWPINPDIYLSRDFEPPPECGRERHRYTIEFLQQEPEVGHWRNAKREIDRQFYEKQKLMVDTSLQILVMQFIYNNKQFMEEHLETSTFHDRQKTRSDYTESRQKISSILISLNDFYRALGDCLKDVREEQR